MISCEMYDYIEIVCLFKYPIEIQLKSGEIITGVGQDTQRNNNKQECILVSIVDSPKKTTHRVGCTRLHSAIICIAREPSFSNDFLEVNV